MPFMPGTLDDELESVGSLPEADVIGILTQATDALAYAWNKHKILHLDIKPSNILLKDAKLKTIQVADWGISRLARDKALYTRAPTRQSSFSQVGTHTSYLAGTHVTRTILWFLVIESTS
jgi:serine/threonine protein kinase